MRRGADRDIAVIGLGCRFPGALDLFGFWANILAGRDLLREIPADRWPVDLFHDPAPNSNDRVACRRGGYLDAPIAFDASDHGIMPLAVAGGEPEQFLVLDAARAALADAALDQGRLSRLRVEVVIGRGNYFNRGNLTRLQHGRMVAQTVGLLAALHPEWTTEEIELLRRDLKSSLPPFEAATIPGQLTNATAGRIADRLDLTGACYVVDAASASSLVALELGRRALLERRADLALIGGVYIEADVDFPLVFQQLRALSPSGEARPFSADADGLVPGEGVGVAVLRRLRDAEEAGDRIYAVLKSVGLASDGRGRGLATPSARGHARAMRRAYRRAGVDPASIGLIEGHGLGVPAADRAELRALRRVFPPEARRPRVLGAVSSQIGHAMPAAGMAGLIKAALALHHRVLPPTRHAKRPSPLLDGSGLELIDTPRPWIHGTLEAPRRAGVNAFGFAGINAHAVLEEHMESADGMTPGAMPEWDSEAILLGAANRDALAELVMRLRDRLKRGFHGSLKDLAYTLNVVDRQPEAPARLGLVAGSVDELVRHLETVEPRLRSAACGSIRDSRGVYFWAEPLARSGGLAFLFPGEGSQYSGMLADLCPHFPELRRVFDTADRIALESGETVPPSRHLFGAANTVSDEIWATDTAVTAVLSSQWALFQVLSRLGLKPDAVAGHSSGELPALAAAGAIQAERALEQQLIELAAVFRHLDANGAIPSARLLAVGTDRARAEAACRAGGGSVAVAIDNCPHQIVLAGPAEAMDRVAARLRSDGILCEDLPFARAYHTPGFAAVLEPLEAFYARIELCPPRIPIYSCSTASRMPDAIAEIRRLAVGQWTRPVAFRETIEAMYRDGLRLFVDVGARGNLCGYVEDTLRGRTAFATAANLPRRSGTLQLNHLVASLFAQGLSLDATYLYARRRPCRVDLEAAGQPAKATVPIHLGFPQLTLSEATIRRLTRRSRGHGDSGAAGNLTPALEDTRLARPGLNGKGQGSDQLQESVRQNGRGPDPRSAPRLSTQRNRPSVLAISDQEPLASSPGPAHHPIPDGAPAMLEFLNTMNDFLATQRQVMEAYLGVGESSVADHASRAEPSPGPAGQLLPEAGPWVGEVVEWQPGCSITTRLPLVAAGDPVAENHTLGGRRVSALQPELTGLPVVPFAVMAEMVAQVGALLVPSGLVLGSLEHVRALRWVPYDDTGWLEIQGASDPAEPFSVRVSLFHHTVDPATHSAERRLVFEGVARFSGSRHEPPLAAALNQRRPRPSRFTAKQLYEEQWLFHGPPMQALAEVGPVSPEGIAGSIKVLSLAGLIRRGLATGFHTDPIVLDTFTHLLGCWGLDCLEGGDVIFPLRMGRLTIHGESPAEGTLVDCRIRVREVEHHRVRVDAELARPDGTAWMQIHDWEDWRFHWPARYRDVFRAPDEVFVGEELPLLGVPATEAVAVWLVPPGDMARPVWRDVLECTQLAPEEREICRSLRSSDARRTHWLWGRIAAKEAVRRLWQAAGKPARFPADLVIGAGPNGCPALIDRARPSDCDLPEVSIAHADGLSLALAARRTGIGVDVIALSPQTDNKEAERLSEGEHSLLKGVAESSVHEWRRRLVAARQAAAKAAGIAPGKAAGQAKVCSIAQQTGTMIVRIESLDQGCEPHALIVRTEHRAEHVWAWTLGERTIL